MSGKDVSTMNDALTEGALPLSLSVTVLSYGCKHLNVLVSTISSTYTLYMTASCYCFFLHTLHVVDFS